MTYHVRTAEAAKGKWRGILLELGVPEAALHNRAGPCPMCGGKDRFRFDNKEGQGTYFCNACGAGSGMELAVKFTGGEFREVAARIDGILGNIKPDAIRPAMTDADARRAVLELAAMCRPIVKGDPVDLYLTGRGLGEIAYPDALRFADAVRDGEGGIRPAMVASVRDAAGKAVTLHRTFLRGDGTGKADMAAPRKLMPGGVPEGAAVRLSDYHGTGPLGIAEGIETALAASALYSLPVWSAINATILAKWQPPEGCDEVAIFADNDPKFGGQAAAYQLAHRLACKGLAVTVQVPPMTGEDFADIYARRKGK